MGEFLIGSFSIVVICYESEWLEIVGIFVISCIPHYRLLWHADYIARWYIVSIRECEIFQNFSLNGHRKRLDHFHSNIETSVPTRVERIETSGFRLPEENSPSVRVCNGPPPVTSTCSRPRRWEALYILGARKVDILKTWEAYASDN